MYEVDSKDVVVKIEDVLQRDLGAPLPQLLVTENRLILSYIVSEVDPKWDGSYVRAIDQHTEGLLITIVDFGYARAHMFGPPNDEAFHGHPLESRGLDYFDMYEVKNSSWIHKLERMNRVHSNHKAEYFDDDRHFIFPFHDKTFECIANEFSYSTFRGTMVEAFAKMLEMVASSLE